MLIPKLLNKVRPSNQALYILQNAIIRTLKSNISEQHEKDGNGQKLALEKITSKYQVFRNQDSEIILDVYEESTKYVGIFEKKELDQEDALEGICLGRGRQGVYDIEDLVGVLRCENAESIFVASVPKENKYVDYICLVTGKSQKHMKAIAQFVRKVYKKKMNKTDLIPKLEGEISKDWMAIDLGNIALHIFSREARILYDLDSLWAVGPQYDKESNKEDQIVDMLQKHSMYLQNLRPAR